MEMTDLMESLESQHQGFPPFPSILGNLAEDARFQISTAPATDVLLEQRAQKQKETEGRLHKILDTAIDFAEEGSFRTRRSGWA